jgi:hypothetical protein
MVSLDERNVRSGYARRIINNTAQSATLPVRQKARGHRSTPGGRERTLPLQENDSRLTLAGSLFV